MNPLFPHISEEKWGGRAVVRGRKGKGRLNEGGRREEEGERGGWRGKGDPSTKTNQLSCGIPMSNKWISGFERSGTGSSNLTGKLLIGAN